MRGGPGFGEGGHEGTVGPTSTSVALYIVVKEGTFREPLPSLGTVLSAAGHCAPPLSASNMFYAS